MSESVAELMAFPLSGIPAKHGQNFADGTQEAVIAIAARPT
jgi:hypothetical protein